MVSHYETVNQDKEREILSLRDKYQNQKDNVEVDS